MADSGAILRAFAALAPAGSRVTYDVVQAGEPFAWIGTAYQPDEFNWGTGSAQVQLPIDASDPALTRLAATDALYPNERLVREGWVFLCGSAMIDDKRRQLFLPLLSRPIRLGRSVRSATITSAGDRELLSLVKDPALAMALEDGAQFGGGAFGGTGLDPQPAPQALVDRLPRLHQWIHATAAAAGLTVDAVLGPDELPLQHRTGSRLVAVVGSGLYLARDPAHPDISSSLLNWAATEHLGTTAFAHLYDEQPPVLPEAADVAIPSPLPLNRAQRQILHASRRAPVTVVSGPPGTGKSHTVAAIAIDAVARGESVLLATLSDHAADALTDLLRRKPGPVPVLFGNAEQRDAIATQLAAGLGTPVPKMQLDAMSDSVRFAQQRVSQLEQDIAHRLWIELVATDASRFEQLAGPLRLLVPAVFAGAVAEEDVRSALSDAARPRSGFLADWRRARAERRLHRLVGSAESVHPDAVVDALAAVRAQRDAAGLELSGGTVLDSAWTELSHADEALAGAVGSYLDAFAHAAGTASAEGRRAVSALATALRAGRGRRRVLLRQIDGHALVEALPLWVGTLRDIEDLLPATPGLFDLVILDESSQVDQIRAAPALLRAKRAVVSGDPYQLRHVTFVADVDVTATLGVEGLAPLADRLDIRRNSVFDAAVAVSPVRWLDEHYRSVPHLIEFSAEHFYRDRLTMMTRHPSNEGSDAIDVVRVRGERDDTGVNIVEVEAVQRIVEELATSGVTSIGVVSPFRAQADRLEEMLIERFPVEEIRRLGLRVGTVHTFQGNERDVIVMSFGLGPDDGGTSRRFVEDPNLFNVLVTRAREKAVVVTSLGDEASGLLGKYLTHADCPPAAPVLGASPSAWVTSLATELERNGVPARVGYPVGSWIVDLSLGQGEHASALEGGVHAEGVAAHIERHRELARAGWRILDAYPSRWSGDAVRAALELTTEYQRTAALE